MALFISFEGPDGSGKSTQADMLATALRERGLDVLQTREPGGTALGERIRDLLLDPSTPHATERAMALLLSASRAQLAEAVIRPALASDRTVVVDRWADSTSAYQGYGLGLDQETIRQLRLIATQGLEPDVTVYVDIAPEIGMRRAMARGERDKLDRQALGFHRRVRAGYLRMIGEEPGRWLVVDGDAPVEAVHEEILAAILPRLKRVASA